MSNFSCPVVRIASLRPIVGADEIVQARVFGYDVIVPCGRYQVGDLAVYVPPDAVLPERLADSLRGHAKLFGKRSNRTRPYRLRGAVSEGILIGPLLGGIEGADAAAALGITKYEPPVPKAWRGDCVYAPELTIHYDIESAKRFNAVLHPGEPIDLTEKIHGTLCAVGVFPGIKHPDLIGGDTAVYSKGLSRTGHVLRADNSDNLYVRITVEMMLRNAIMAAFRGRPATVFGEIYGRGIQDLDYHRDDPSFALFDIYLGRPGVGHWLNRAELSHIAGEIAPPVPVLYRGPLTENCVSHAIALKTVMGAGSHLAEGVVIRPLRERIDRRIGRVVLKHVSPEYLARSGGTEYQ